MPSSARTITVYPERGEKYDVLRQRDGVTELVNEEALKPRGNVAVDFHQNVINAYHSLECEGKLPNMSPRAKQNIRDLHTVAQTPEYWQ